ncbi:alpha-amylase family glycosyl hydrolase [Pelolinea submarina]|uniref:Maltogenic amylase n=1 Tax=Pelolinea submarina TaxID=913107 RepID=A0A347ZQ60_9CHLR|nr:alpha-amylase family glycosyl hydrolase [Pelolinea submarina]REG06230.1 maltogenic amylase [Pelolinea submarina]BBB47441.1 alpha-amylase [Pelolinea submarina]
MAKDTPKDYRSLVIYEIYVRSHSPQGTFQGVAVDLPRIKDLGVDIIWLMPIHPIGRLNRKGSLGCPYSIADYFSVHPEYGSLDDFKTLIHKAHALDLKVMIDVVYNHTAHDAILVNEHPDWYHTGPDGHPATTVPEWSDVIDLDFSHLELWEYLISALEQWAGLGVDGFRCDVASIVPLEFWVQARTAVTRINPQIIWLAESVEARWVAQRRSQDLQASSDSQLYQVFDITYDYDVFDAWKNVIAGSLDLQLYLDLLRLQDCIYPENYVKLRFVENHDNERVMAVIKDSARALAWTAFQAFNKGAWLIYAGQESAAEHLPSLFEKEPLDWGGYPLADFHSRLAAIKKDPAVMLGELNWIRKEPAVLGLWYTPVGSLAGIFNLNGESGQMEIDLPDGVYSDRLSGQNIIIRGGRLDLPSSAVVFNCQPDRPLPAYQTLLF